MHACTHGKRYNGAREREADLSVPELGVQRLLQFVEIVLLPFRLKLAEHGCSLCTQPLVKQQQHGVLEQPHLGKQHMVSCVLLRMAFGRSLSEQRSQRRLVCHVFHGNIAQAVD